MLLEQIKRGQNAHRFFKPGDKILVALSGGSDSCALLHVLIALASEYNITLCAAHLNHSLRGEESDRDHRFVQELCQSLNIPLVCEKADISALANGTGIEEFARQYRYDFLERARKTLGADKIATAHNAQDNAETVLFNLARGTSLTGLCGIPATRQNIIRPMIFAQKQHVLDFLAQNMLTYITDSTNEQDIYTRNKIRRHVVPVLEQINPAFSQTVLNMTLTLKEENDFLEKTAIGLFNQGSLDAKHYEISIETLKTAHPAIAKRALALALKALVPRQVTQTYIEQLYKLVGSTRVSAQVTLPQGFVAVKEYNNLAILQPVTAPPAPLVLQPDTPVSFGDYTLVLTNNKEILKNYKIINIFPLDCDIIDKKTVVRSRQTGDKIRVNKVGKSLKKLFIDKKVPKSLRERTPVVCQGDVIIGVGGLCGGDLATPSQTVVCVLQ